MQLKLPSSVGYLLAEAHVLHGFGYEDSKWQTLRDTSPIVFVVSAFLVLLTFAAMFKMIRDANSKRKARRKEKGFSP